MSVPSKLIQRQGPIDRVIRVPGSKSITNRALLIAALAHGESILTGALDSEDTRIMIDALEQLGLNLEYDSIPDLVRVRGTGGAFPNQSADLWIGNSGTSARFLTAALAGSQGVYRLHGKPRMHQRPIQDLLVALNQLGADVRSENDNGCPPVQIHGQGPLHGETSVSASVSSQFLSGLLLAAGASSESIRLNLVGELVSRPYIEMSLAMMRAFGSSVCVDSSFQSFDHFNVTPYAGREYAIEPDASAASYVFAIPAIVGGKVTVENLTRSSLQGDIRFVDLLAQMGCQIFESENSLSVVRPPSTPLHGIDVDMNAISDTVPTLAVVALFAEGSTVIRNVKHIRYKETDRIAAVVAELRRLGAHVEEFDDGMQINGSSGRSLHGASIKTYDDHRIAMSFALAGLAIDNIKIENPECTVKTWPLFFNIF